MSRRRSGRHSRRLACLRGRVLGLDDHAAGPAAEQVCGCRADPLLAGRGVPSRTEPLVGRDGQVTHDIDPTLGTGRINVGGEDWAARCAEPLPIGTKIRVVAADGIVLEVTRA